MPQLANERQELYAKMRAKGFPPAKAANAAGYAAGSAVYAGLEKDPDVLNRIAEIMDELNERKEAQKLAAMEAAKVVGQLTGIERSYVVRKLAENAELAQRAGDFKESNAALKLIGEDLGMFKGPTGDDSSGQSTLPPTFDLDALHSVLDRALPGPTEPTEEEIEALTPVQDSEAMMKLLDGHKAVQQRRSANNERALLTGSETDAAFTADPDLDEPDPNLNDAD
jgi:hypothetical protein